jgi:hypothetical protein
MRAFYCFLGAPGATLHRNEPQKSVEVKSVHNRTDVNFNLLRRDRTCDPLLRRQFRPGDEKLVFSLAFDSSSCGQGVPACGAALNLDAFNSYKFDYTKLELRILRTMESSPVSMVSCALNIDDFQLLHPVEASYE